MPVYFGDEGSLMYIFLIALQIIIISFAVFSTILLSRLHGSVDNKFLFTSALCIDIYAVGYLIEMLCRTEESAWVVLSFEYMGLSFIALCFTIFIFEYCHVKWAGKWLIIPGLGYCLFVYFSVITTPYLHLYYKDLKMVDSGYFMHVETVKSALYFSFVFYQIAIMILSAIILASTMKRVNKATEKRRILLLVMECLVPIVGIIGTVFIDLGGWDPSPLLLTFLVTAMAITLKGGKFVDILNLAREKIFSNVGNAVIITNSSFLYLESNSLADSIFPELKNIDSGYDLELLPIKLRDLDKDEVYFTLEDKYYRSTVNALYERETLVGYIINITDMTDIRRQMDEMERLKNEADAANEAKSVFLANMSHEIRTPLNAIIGMAELSEKEKSESIIKEYNAQIKSAGKMLLGIVSDVLDFSKAESGRLELVQVEFDTAEFLNSVINVTNMRIGDKPVDFIVDIDPNIPKALFGDDVHLRQILLNLLSNAEKFTQSGHIKLSLEAKSEGHGMRLYGAVEDTGIGIKEEDRDKLFTAFQQLDSKRNRRITGSGLGLAIFAQLVTKMGGSYRLESKYGEGSTFFFDVSLDIADNKPFAEATREAITVAKFSAFSLYGTAKEIELEKTEERKTSESDVPDYSAYSVLVVDDNKVNVKVLAAFLKHFNIVADTVYSGYDAISLVKNKKFDLIFMDHMMPDMDGVETTRHLRDMEEEWLLKVPIIACTANVVKGVEELFLQAGMNDFVPKPIQLDTLKKIMAKYLK